MTIQNLKCIRSLSNYHLLINTVINIILHYENSCSVIIKMHPLFMRTKSSLFLKQIRLPNVISGERLGTKEQRLDSINFTLSSTLETLVSAEDLIRGSSLC